MNKKKVKQMLDQGKGPTAIAEALGVHRTTIHRIMEQNDWENPQARQIQIRRKWVSTMKKQGASVRDLAGQLSVSEATVRRDLRMA